MGFQKKGHFQPKTWNEIEAKNSIGTIFASPITINGPPRWAWSCPLQDKVPSSARGADRVDVFVDLAKSNYG